MADPLTLAAVVGGIGAVGSTISQIAANNQNAKMAEAEAKAARERAAIDESRYRDEARRNLARGEAIAAASGLDITSGTPMDVLLESAYKSELNARRIRYDGAVESEALKMQAKAYRSRNWGVAFEGLTKGASVYSQWWKNKP